MRKNRDSRQAIVDAATVEFATRGFTAASVDLIARRARVNKAMIYYHFGSKVRLYRAILSQVFDLLFLRIHEIAESRRAPDEKIAAFIEAVVREGEARPDFPRMMAREIADRGRRLDAATIRTMARLPRTVAGIIEEGIAAGRFVEVDPVLTYFILVGPMMLYLMSAPVRVAIGRLKLFDTDRLRTEAFIQHLQAVARRALVCGPARAPSVGRARPGGRRRSNSARPGDDR